MVPRRGTAALCVGVGGKVNPLGPVPRGMVSSAKGQSTRLERLGRPKDTGRMIDTDASGIDIAEAELQTLAAAAAEARADS